MSIPFEFPVVWLDPDDPEISEVSYCNASMIPIRLDREPYEMDLNARGSVFHLIFGSQINGNFLCIPDWHLGCELSDLYDRSWNLHSILHADSHLEYEDATAITWALSMISAYIRP